MVDNKVPEMENLKLKRQRVKAGISRIYNVCLSDRATLDDVKVRVSKLDDLFAEYEHIQDEIDDLINTTELRTIEEAYRNEMETKYFTIKSTYSALSREESSNQTIIENDTSGNISQAIQIIAESQNSIGTLLERLTADRARHSSPLDMQTTGNLSQQEIRLPQIQIPEFDGSYTDWIRFRDLFEALVHGKSTISKVEKLEYLQTRLKGEALSLIKHLKPTNDNYEVAWQIIKDKYDKSDHVKRAYFELLFDQPAIRSTSVGEIKCLYNNSNESFNALKVLNEPVEHWDSVLLFHLERKLDQETHILWCREKKVSTERTFGNFLRFLEARISELESIQRNVAKTLHKPQTNRVRGQTGTYSSTVQACVCCSENHFLFQCEKFKDLSVDDRYHLVRQHKLCLNCNRSGHFAATCKASSCKLCGGRHNTLLHFPSGEANNQLDPESSGIVQATYQSFPVNGSNVISTSTTMLPTMIIMVRDRCNQLQQCRALLDSGAQATLISEECIQRLGLPRHHNKTLMMGVGVNTGNYSRGKVSLEIVCTKEDRVLKANAYCLSKLTQNLPTHDILIGKFDYFKNLKLADMQFHKSSKIDIIMGADMFAECVLPDTIVHPTGSPMAMNTIFGWVIMGSVKNQPEQSLLAAHFTFNLDEQLQRFWEMDELPHNSNILSEEELQAEKHYQENVQKLDNGRYMVRLPLRDNFVLGESVTSALKRFKSVERKLDVNPNLREDYSKFMQEYLELHHMESDMAKSTGNRYFLPHHAVLKPGSSTTKVRVVFDASCKTSNGYSLNDHLLVGPTIQDDLFTIILKFRKYKIAMSADIEKMYRQVLIHPDDRSLQCILWRNSKREAMGQYHLNTVTYGTSAAPFLATRTLHQISVENVCEHPEVSHAIDHHFYVDDFMYCSKDIPSAIQLKDTICSKLSSAGFNLRKWSSNSTEFIDSINYKDRETSGDMVIDSTETVKTLGLLWETRSDNFKYSIILHPIGNAVTKRLVLSDIAKIFDPVGWLAPVIVAMKIFMQRLWLQGIGWDEQIPDELFKQWCTIRNDVGTVSNIRIPRWVKIEDDARLELHGFADASEQAYAATVYLKVIGENGTIHTSLIAAKTRVAPVKQISLPRLELCAAHLLAKLITKVHSSLALENCETYGWSDSTVVLAWLSDHPRRWKSFVANRTSYIIDRIPPSHWRHIPSKNNPADLATRGTSSSNLLHNYLWWCGPEELHSANTSQCKFPDVNESIDMEEKREHVLHLGLKTESSIIERYSDYTKLVRITALVCRFIYNCRVRKEARLSGFLVSSEIQEAEYKLMGMAQMDSYSSEMHILKKGGQLSSSHRLCPLAPFIDERGLMRVGGRIEHANISYNQKHPLILHKDHTLTSMIVEQYHLKYLHAAHRQMLYLIGLKYWISSVSRIVKRCIFKCTRCMRFRNIPHGQQMGNLPEHRLQQTSAFINTGVDFAGPVYVRSWKGRGCKLYKAWVAVFVCLTTKAIHLELVSELSTPAFIATLRRFVSRRGRPLHIYSDNGTNFVGSNQQLRELYQYLHETETQELIQREACKQQIQWHFSPPSAPHFGGIWEAGVKSTKYHIKRILSDSHVTFEEMYTVLCQIEACLNSRPLCLKFEGDVDPLTPAHFLILRPMVAVPDENLENVNVSYCNRWKYLQKLIQDFWRKWSREYLSQLQQRPKWAQKMTNLKVDDIVIVKDDNLPPTKWSIARILETHPGSDGLIRVVTLKTAKGTYKRPISKLCPLFIEI